MKIVSEPCKTRKLLSYLFDFPWPLSLRHCIIEYNAMPAENGVMAIMKTPIDTYMGEKLPTPSKGEVCMKINFGWVFIQYLDEENTNLIVVMSVDGNIVNFI